MTRSSVSENETHERGRWRQGSFLLQEARELKKRAHAKKKRPSLWIPNEGTDLPLPTGQGRAHILLGWLT